MRLAEKKKRGWAPRNNRLKSPYGWETVTFVDELLRYRRQELNSSLFREAAADPSLTVAGKLILLSDHLFDEEVERICDLVISTLDDPAWTIRKHGGGDADPEADRNRCLIHVLLEPTADLMRGRRRFDHLERLIAEAEKRPELDPGYLYELRRKIR